MPMRSSISRPLAWRRAAALLAAAVVLLVASPPEASATERESLLHRCWIEGIPRASTAESRPVRGAPGGRVGLPERTLSAFAPIEPRLRGSIRRVDLRPGSPRLIALTFDLCEQPGEVAGYDGAIVDILRERGAKATFFAGGKWLLTHAERAQQLIADRNFEIANHGWTHRNVRLLSGAALQEEIVRPQAAYEEMRERLSRRQCVAGHEAAMSTIPARMRLMRFPYGTCNPPALQATAEAGLLAVQWDVSSGDPSPGQSAAEITAAVLRQVRPGSIVIFHANGRGHHTAEALPGLLKALKARGFVLATVSELIASGTPVIADTCYDARPGDTDRYDRLVGAGRVPTKASETPRAGTVPR